MSVSEAPPLDLSTRFQPSINDQIYREYGEHFVNIIGLDRIRKISVMTAQQAHLQHGFDFEFRNFGHYYLPELVCRGLDGQKRPFILIKVNDYLSANGMGISSALLIINRFPSTSQKHSYLAVQKCKEFFMRLIYPNDCKEYRIFEGNFHNFPNEEMSEDDLKQIPDLLDGKKVYLSASEYLQKSDSRF